VDVCSNLGDLPTEPLDLLEPSDAFWQRGRQPVQGRLDRSLAEFPGADAQG
jgi:hypothetical protein